ncbi:MAG TPA: HypC/HybG/HupF family hydrogenase formation chaperone [Acidimicrobiia bacterium]|nr:HypC/HybG/HupF family hydrogenase formation chaperone [Acidimicrobiia bacterium]
MNEGSLEGAVCEMHDGCLTCGDVAVELTVVAVDGADARCRADTGEEETVAVGLVGPVEPGARLLVHAGVAIERVGDR